MLTLNDGRSELWQWDTGRTLAVDADCSQVHFSNKVFGRSIDVDVVDGAAIIPDILLQTDKDLNVWAFVGTDENGYTKISKIFTVNRRNKPADYVFTPTDQMTMQTIQRQIGDLADLTTEAKDTLVAAINEAARTGGGAGSMELRVADGYVQYSRDGGMTWTNLIAMSDLKGDPGIYYGTTPPTGDTHPVWIDPDGGPDDGGLLPVVTSADNGKVLRVVNSAWSAADMPTGGTDMGITGAKVGQIAKITAVDDTGKPTAWEAVDMPTGADGTSSGFMVLNASIDIGGTACADISTADSGQSYADLDIQEFVMEAVIRGNPDLTNPQRVVFAALSGSISKEVGILNSALLTKNGDFRCFMVHARKIMSQTWQIRITGSSSASMYFKSNIMTDGMFSSDLTGMRIVGGFGATAFGEGSTVRVWGK